MQCYRADDTGGARLPALLEELGVRFIEVLHQEFRTHESQQHEPAIADRLTIELPRLALIAKDQRPIGTFDGGAQLDGHASVTEAARTNVSPAESEGRIPGEPMLVSPEPEQDPIQVWPQLATDARILGVEGAEPLMMTQQNDGAPVCRVREDDLLQPTAAGPVKADKIDDELEEGDALGVITGVQADNAPIGVLEAQIAGLLPQRRECVTEVARTPGVHLVVPVERVGAARTPARS